jgi:hypothetical protein
MIWHQLQIDASHELPDATGGFQLKLECKAFSCEFRLCKKVDQREGYVTLSLTPTIFEQEIYKFLQSYAAFNYCSLIFSDVFL